MRLALMASPRCGNNWVRSILRGTSGFPHFAAHSVEELPAAFPPNCIINVHAVRDETTQRFFERLSCKVLVLGRHPLDVFVSVLQFARNEPAVGRWLNGRCQIPANCNELAPNDKQWVDWMCSEGARALLSVTLSWWQRTEADVCIKYEDLLDDPLGRFSKLFNTLNVPVIQSMQSILNFYSVPYFAQFNNHGWLGQKNTYARFITEENGHKVQAYHKRYFDALQYELELDPSLQREDARVAYLVSVPETRAISAA